MESRSGITVEGDRVLRESRAAWQALQRTKRGRIDVAVVRLVDLDENARMGRKGGSRKGWIFS